MGSNVRMSLVLMECLVCQVRVLNYTKQGRAFWNLFYMAPIYSRQDGVVIHYVGVQTPVTSGVSSRTQQVVAETVKEVVEVADSAHSVEEGLVDLRLRGGGQLSHLHTQSLMYYNGVSHVHCFYHRF